VCMHVCACLQANLLPGMHACRYAIINVKQVDSFRLIQLLNPWGTFEWQVSGIWLACAWIWGTCKGQKILDFKGGLTCVQWHAGKGVLSTHWSNQNSLCNAPLVCSRSWPCISAHTLLAGTPEAEGQSGSLIRVSVKRFSPSLI